MGLSCDGLSRKTLRLFQNPEREGAAPVWCWLLRGLACPLPTCKGRSRAPRSPTFCIKHLARLAKASQQEKIGEND